MKNKDKPCDSCKDKINISQISEGWASLSLHMMGGLDKESVAMANSRRKICDDCDQLTQSKVKFLMCKQCGCYYPMLAYAKSKSCPLGKW